MKNEFSASQKTICGVGTVKFFQLILSKQLTGQIL